MPADRERDRRSLQDLAKMASQSSMTPPPPSMRAPLSSGSAASLPSGRLSSPPSPVEAKKDDSGIVDLAMAAQSDPQAAVRAQTTPLASDGLFDDEPASIRPPPVSAGAVSSPLSVPSQPMPSMPPFSVAPAAPASHAPIASSSVASSAHQPVAKKRGGAVIALVFGGLVAVSAVAAGGFFFMKQQAKAKADALALNTPAVTAPAATTPAVTTPAPAETAAAAPAPEATLDPNALPSTPDPKLALAAKPGARAVAPVAVAAAAKPAAAPVKEEGPKLSQKDLPTAPVGPGGDLGAAMKGAVGADGKPAEPTPAAGASGPQFAAGTVPQKPSQGAVTGALGAVLPGARACLGPDDAVSRASITFTSAGTVQSVGVTGGAAGKPAEACIKGALGKAKLAPFAEPTYTANITVR
ncbi:MAG TPA: hypothetical protein VLT33_42040, partial [Labilithrix sp.]|nr:hypothetical protein [Labilithrix sp.]